MKKYLIMSSLWALFQLTAQAQSDAARISYPREWSIVPAGQAVVLKRRAEDRDHVSVMVEDLEKPTSPDEYIDRAVPLMSHALRAFEQISREPAKLGELDAVRFAYRHGLDARIDAVSFVVTTSDKAFLITTFVEDGPDDAQLETALAQVAQSFRLPA